MVLGGPEVLTSTPTGIARLRHHLPRRLRLQCRRASAFEARQLAHQLGAEWHRFSGSVVLTDPPDLNDLAAQLDTLGWWLEVPESPTPAASLNPWGQLVLEVGASLMGASVGQPLGTWIGANLAGAGGAAAGSFLGLVVGAVVGTEVLHWQRRPSDHDIELGQAGRRVGGRLAGRLGEEAGTLAGLRIGGWIGGPLGASAGALIGTLVVGQMGEDAALHHIDQWRHPLGWLRQTGQSAAGEAATQTLFGLLGGAVLQAPGRRAGERVGLYLGRRMDWLQFKPVVSVTADHLVGDH